MTTRKNLPSNERRELTIRTVLDLCGRGNPSKITMASIAEAMQVTQGALFRHFRSKEEIWSAVLRWVAERFLQRVDRIIEEERHPDQTLRALFLAQIEFIIEHPGVPRMLFAELQYTEPTPARHMARTLLVNYRRRLGEILREGRDQGLFARDLDTEAAAVQFIGTIQGMVLQSLIAGDVHGLRDRAPGMLKLYMRGISRASGGSE